MSAVVEVLSAVLLLSGGVLALVAALGLLRLPDALARLQAATAPQTLGLACVAAGAVPLVGWRDGLLVLVLVTVFQLATAPVIGQLTGRAAHRAGAVAPGALLVDELREAEGAVDPGGGPEQPGHRDGVDPPGEG